MAGSNLRIVVAIPVFNDWDALRLLLPALDDALAIKAMRATVVVIDDGSTIDAPRALVDRPLRALGEVEILRVARNLGHQRAIAIGLTFVHQQRPCDVVVVMDGDGEDRPEDVPRLVDELASVDGAEVVFAARLRRAEGMVFRAFYALYRATHRVLTGVAVRVGNFSAMSHRHLSTFVLVSEAWNHYAAAIFHARIPHRSIPTARGARLGGRPAMRFVDLVSHGLSAIAVFSDVVGVRVLLGSVALFVTVLALLIATVLIRLCTSLAIPGWATYSSGLLVVLSSQLLMVAFVGAFLVLNGRNDVSFIPLRDYATFVREVVRVYPPVDAARRDG